MKLPASLANKQGQGPQYPRNGIAPSGPMPIGLCHQFALFFVSTLAGKSVRIGPGAGNSP